MKKTILTIIFTMLSAIMLYSDEECECNKSTWFWNDEIKEKKQFIRDFIDNPDSLIYPEFYAKYKSFRIRNGFIEDYEEFFTGQEYAGIQNFQNLFMTKKYHVSCGRKFMPSPPSDSWATTYKKKYIFAYCHSMKVKFGKIKYLKGDIITGNDNEDYGYFNPKIYFNWYCKNGEWILGEILIDISYRNFRPDNTLYFEDW